jgi:hypothetical protein
MSHSNGVIPTPLHPPANRLYFPKRLSVAVFEK